MLPIPTERLRAASSIGVTVPALERRHTLPLTPASKPLIVKGAEYISNPSRPSAELLGWTGLNGALCVLLEHAVAYHSPERRRRRFIGCRPVASSLHTHRRDNDSTTA